MTVRLSTPGTLKVSVRLASLLLLSAALAVPAAAQTDFTAEGIHSGVLAWILQHNSGLKADFLKTELPDRTILLPDGRTVPIFKTKQFLGVNFRLRFHSGKKEGVKLVETQETHLRKLMARPEFYSWIRHHRWTYKINGKKVSSLQAYNYFRHINRNLHVTVSRKVHAPVGGGNGINAPSWAVWKQMNLFFHEACHCIGIGHNSGGLSGPLAGKMRDWDRKHLWNYDLIDLNALQVP